MGHERGPAQPSEGEGCSERLLNFDNTVKSLLFVIAC